MLGSILRRLVPLVILLGLLTSRSAAAQDLFAAARVVSDSIIQVFIDTDQGPQPGAEFDGAVRELFVNTDWGFFDNGQLIISRNVQPLLRAFYMAAEGKDFFLIHYREARYSLNGTIYKTPGDPTSGTGDFFYTFTTQNGSQPATAYLQLRFSFAR